MYMKLEKQAKIILLINEILLGIGIVCFVLAILSAMRFPTSFVPFIILFSWLFFIFIINYFVQSYGQLLLTSASMQQKINLLLSNQEKLLKDKENSDVIFPPKPEKTK